MKNSAVAMFCLSLCVPAAGLAQESYRVGRSTDEQRAISQIGQAEYYMRMALRSLEASERIGKAPYFDYQSARDDIERALGELNTYLKGDESIEQAPAVPLVIDGRYFAESIRSSLANLRSEEEKQSEPRQSKIVVPRPAAAKVTAPAPVPAPTKAGLDKDAKRLQPNSPSVLPPPVIMPQTSKAKRDKIEEILKKGL